MGMKVIALKIGSQVWTVLELRENIMLKGLASILLIALIFVWMKLRRVQKQYRPNEASSAKERLQLALEASKGGVWEMNLLSGTISFDDTIKEILGYDVPGNETSIDQWNQMVGEHFSGNDYELALPLRDVTANADVIIYSEYNKKYLQCYAKPVYNHAGKIVRRIGMTIDVTERERLMRKLQEAQETFDVALQSSNAGYWEIPFTKRDGEYIITYEENFAKLFRIKHRQPFTTTEWSQYLYPILDPVEYADFHDFLRNFDESVERVVSDALLKFPDGTETYIKNSAQVAYDKNGKPEKMIGLSVDLSAIKKAEHVVSEQLKQQQLTAAISQEFISLGDEEGAVERSLNLLGEFLKCYRIVITVKSMDGDTMRNAYEWYNRQIVKEPCVVGRIEFLETVEVYRQVFFEEAPYAIVEGRDGYQHLRKDWNLKSILFLPLYVDGEFYGGLEIMKSRHNNDWTQSEIELAKMVSGTFSMFFGRQKVAENLVRAMLSAESANNAKSSFLSNMSHEIRTPLNAIVGMTNIAMKENLSDSTRKYMQNIKDASDVLLDVINNILDMSKIEAAKLELINDYFELDKILDNLYNIVSVRANEKQQKIVFMIENDVPNAYNGDSFRVIQILTNVLYNAIKFSGENTEIIMHVALDTLIDEQAMLHFEVIDQGVGMTPEQKVRLFNPFEQGDTRTVRKYGGTGLGLTIAKQVAELMDGDIVVESELGEGSVFTIMLNLNVVSQQENACHDITATDIENVDLTGKKILLVEDVEINREIVKAMLEHTGVIIEEAENGRIGVTMFKADVERYDMVLMDIQMPEMDGYTATREIRQLDKKIPIVAMTAHAFKEDEMKSLASGMNGHIIKPLDERILLEQVVKHIMNED